MRKPRPYLVNGKKIAECVEWAGGDRSVMCGFWADMSEEMVERLAAWLLKAAAWIREQEDKRC